MDEPLGDIEFETRMLVQKIGAITGEPEDILVLRALEERLQRLTEPLTPAERAHRILKILDTSLWQLTPASRSGRSTTQEEQDVMLGYGPEGV